MPESRARGFGDVDRTSDPSTFVQYLDTVTGTAGVQAYKRRSIELLRLEPGQRVLDVGCGTGDDSRALGALVGDGGLVVGIDFAETMVAEARRRARDAPGRFEFAQGDVHRLEYPDACFDAARADRVFQHLVDPARALQEVARVVRPGGWIVISDPDWDTLFVDAPDRAVVRAVLDAHRDTLAHPWMGRQLGRFFRDAGLAEVAVEVITPYLRDLPSASRAFYLHQGATEAAAAGAITRSEADAFIAYLEDAAATGVFFAGMSVFIAAGRRSSLPP